MKNLGVIFGGVTCEHDVSVVSGLQLIENVNRSKYKVIPIYIHADGKWYTGEKLLDTKVYNEFEKYEKDLKEVAIIPNKKKLIIFEKGILGTKNIFIDLDVVIPAMHGMNGEDGTLQGLLEMANIPYSSSGVLGASVNMDKIIMKKLFEADNLPVLPYTYFLRSEWEKDSNKIISEIEEKLSYPMFVKPANLGSSIGINKAKNRDGLVYAISVGINYDSRIVVEKGLENMKEINCAALGTPENVIASSCEEPVRWEEFLTFEDKYIRGGKSKSTGSKQGMESMGRKLPAEISIDKTKEIQDLTVKAFKLTNSKGVVRIDFMIDMTEDKVYLNEINTIPGSFSFYLWEYDGIKYPELIDRLVEIAEKDNEKKNKNSYTYKSDIIGKVIHGSKGNKNRT